MATNVYLSGKSVIVDQDGQPLLTIIQQYAKYTVFQPTLSSNGVSTPIATTMQFIDRRTGEVRTELIADVQNQTGGTFATLKLLQDYLDFIPLADTTQVTKEGATSENQVSIITQNEEIKTSVSATNDNTKAIGNIKELNEQNVKILKKIYNPE